MRRKLCVGLLRESRWMESRSPLTPHCVNQLIKKGIDIEVESSPTRIFKDREYKKAGARVLDRFQKATLLLGIKEPRIEDLYPGKIYMLFSHTAKAQAKNMPLLKAFLENNVTLVDYEKIADPHGKRLVYFGRFAGVCGFVDSLHYLGKKLEWEGIKNPFFSIKPAKEYSSLKKIKEAMVKLDNGIANKGFDKRLSPFIISITGHGNVSRGVQEIFDLLNPVEVHPRVILRFIKHQKGMRNKIYKMVFVPEEKFRSKDGNSFYLEDYMKRPEKYESNLDRYLPYLNMLINGSYWDNHYPRLVTKKMINKLSKEGNFRLEFINDIACDVKGSIELTYRTTTQENPIFTYDPRKRKFFDGYKHRGITILAIDNLPSELPRDASQEFSSLIRDYVYRIASCGTPDIKRHAGVPAEIRKAVITQGGRLTRDFKYLSKWVR